MALCENCEAMPLNGPRSAKHSGLKLTEDVEMNGHVQAHFQCAICSTIWGWRHDPETSEMEWKYAATIRIGHIREAEDGESVMFELIKGDDRKQALISRTALLQFQGVQAQDLVARFNLNATQIWQAGMAKWDREPESAILKLGSLDF